MHVRAHFLALLLLSIGCSKSNETSTTTTTSTSTPSAGTVEKRPAPPPPAEAPAVVMSCQQKTLCAEWSGLTLSELKEAKDSCSEPGEKFGAGACPRQNVMGICKHRKEKVTMYIYKSLIVSNAKEAKELCDDGEFTAAK